MLKLGQDEYCSFWSYRSFITEKEKKEMRNKKRNWNKIGNSKHPKN